MKNNLMVASIVSAVTFLAAGSAMADGFGVNGYGEYAFEAESFELGLGATYDIDAFSFSTEAVFTKFNDLDLEFQELTVGASYELSAEVDVYTEVLFDDDMEYAETTVGVEFNF